MIRLPPSSPRTATLFPDTTLFRSAVREGKRGPFLQIGAEMVVVELALQLVRRQHHDDIGPFRRVGGGEHLEFGALGLLRGRRSGAQRDRKSTRLNSSH